MPLTDAPIRSVLLVRNQSQVFAVPLADVVEVMRPLPIEPQPSAPGFVPGLAIVRGAPVPVVDLDRLFEAPSGPKGRWVTLRAGDRVVALAVAEVLGIRAIAESELRRLPPLLTEAFDGHVDRLGRLDGALCGVLEAARLLPEATWNEAS